MHVAGSWIDAGAGVMVVFAVALGPLTAAGTSVVRGATARRRRVELGVPASDDREPTTGDEPA